jgi:propanol-preferring alcohol dehydrogenase
MKAMVMSAQKEKLKLTSIAEPVPESDEVLVEVISCGVCRTDLHVMDGELTKPKLPLVLGHEIIGRVAKVGSSVSNFKTGQLVGVPWLGKTCGHCRFCLSHQENLCDNAIFTGYTRDGGYEEFAIANQNFCFALPDKYDPIHSAPLMCAGLIGWRSYRMIGKTIGDAENIGIYGFGGAAHILTQILHQQGMKVFAFSRNDDERTRSFAEKVGAAWSGKSGQKPPELLDATLIFAPVGELVLDSLKILRKGGVVICGGIHMSDIPPIPYDLLWGERTIRSVANLTRDDGLDFMKILDKYPVKVETHQYELEDANTALDDLRAGRFDGAAVLKIRS